MREYRTCSVQETEQLASEFAKELKRGDVIAFTGGMGAGKTAFVRGLAKGLGVSGEVSSPTYAIVNEYRGNPALYHLICIGWNHRRIYSPPDIMIIWTKENLYSR